MKKFLKSFRYGEKGFTLIELLIVIAILGVLAAVAIPNVQKFTRSGLKAACLAEAETVQVAVDATMADGGMTSIAGATFAPADANWNITSVLPAVTADVRDFLRRAAKGTFSVASTGLVTVASYPGLTSVEITDINAKLQ